MSTGVRQEAISHALLRRLVLLFPSNAVWPHYLVM